MTEDEMVGWHHLFYGHEPRQTLGDGEGQESLACYSLWGHEESDMTEAIEHTHTLCWLLLYNSVNQL